MSNGIYGRLQCLYYLNGSLLYGWELPSRLCSNSLMSGCFSLCWQARRPGLETDWKKMSPWEEAMPDCAGIDHWLMLTRAFDLTSLPQHSNLPLHSNSSPSATRSSVVSLIRVGMTLIIDKRWTGLYDDNCSVGLIFKTRLTSFASLPAVFDLQIIFIPPTAGSAIFLTLKCVLLVSLVICMLQR